MTIQSGPKTAAKISNTFRDHLPTDISDNVNPLSAAASLFTCVCHLRFSAKYIFLLKMFPSLSLYGQILKLILGMDAMIYIYSTQYNPMLLMCF